MSSDEFQGNGADLNGDHHVDLPSPNATIKFFRNDFTIEGHKDALAAGSTFFYDHFLEHPASKKVMAPKEIRPGINISFETVQTAIDHLHGEDIADDVISRDGIPLLLAARAFGIIRLEERVKEHLMQKLDRQFELIASEFQIIDLAIALRELYGHLGGEVGLGNEVAGVVASAAAHACSRKLGTLKRCPDFMLMLRNSPQLMYDILASDVETTAVAENGESLVGNGEVAKSGDDVEQESKAGDRDFVEGNGEAVMSGGDIEQEDGAKERGTPEGEILEAGGGVV